MIQDIPKFYTALAEWLACLMIVLQLKRRWSWPATAVLLALSFGALCGIQYVIGIVPIQLWIPGMIVALAIMYGTIAFTCRIPAYDAGFYWAIAFIFAEFAASLVWQFYSFFAEQVGESLLFQGLFLILYYGVSFGILFRTQRKRLKDKADLKVTAREMTSAAVVAVGSFLISNISYVSSETPLSGSMGAEAFYIRTLVDLAGVIMLFALQDRWQDYKTRQELDAMQTLLHRQYEQYRVSRESMEAINRKYHDLKHQIGVIRLEKDDKRREEYLAELESGMETLGTIHKTGSSVLDAILSGKQLYCTQHEITMTVVADGGQLDFMSTMDICSIFGNALDNAIESVRKLKEPEKRLIRVAVFTQNGFLMVRVENYCQSPLEMVEGEYQTTKRDKSSHGYGLKSIRYVSEKYGGSLSAQVEDGWFCLRVLIPIPKLEEEH